MIHLVRLNDETEYEVNEADVFTIDDHGYLELWKDQERVCVVSPGWQLVAQIRGQQ